MAILKRGLAGEPVNKLQEKLGLDADGQFGPKTEEAVREYGVAVFVRPTAGAMAEAALGGQRITYEAK
jgi:peptidoglycan hydrolase-like protein with peptidoglycan-binding domain